MEPVAKERKKRKSKSVGANLPPQNGKTRDEAAALLNVGARSVDHATAVIEHGSDELIAAVDGGNVSVSRAAEVCRTTGKNGQLAEVKRRKRASGDCFGGSV